MASEYRSGPDYDTMDAGRPGGIASDASQRDPPRGEAVLYTVQDGDTLAGVADRFGVSVAALTALNMITDPATLDAGRELRIPDTSPDGAVRIGPAGDPLARGADTTIYTVQPGETLAEIALRLGASADALARLNDLADPNDLQAGQELLVPAG